MVVVSSCAAAFDGPVCQRLSLLVSMGNNAHDDLFVLVGAIVGAALIPFLIRMLTGGAG